MKKIIRNIINKLGYDIKKINKLFKNSNLSYLLKDKINENPIIFDVGANRGQSIEEYKKIFKNPTIHAFEPIKSEFDFMFEKFKNDKSVFLNNYALGEVAGEKDFNITACTGSSSFNKINNNTRWIKVRSKEQNTTISDFISSRKIKISTLDEYCLDNKINQIDLLKIDTQGYEDKVLQGSKYNLESNIIKAIVTEIMFDNVYDKYFSFSDIEKFIAPNDFRMVGVYLTGNNLFDNLTFFADVCYLNKSYYDL